MIQDILSTESDYIQMIQDIKQYIYKSQYEALQIVNAKLISVYLYIGEMLVVKKKDHIWGDKIIPTLAKDLQSSFPGIKGFSCRNITYRRDFYLFYIENPILQPLVAKISRTKNILILTQCKDDLEREFYIRMVKKFGRTKAVLMNHLSNKTYQKYLTNQTSFAHTLSQDYSHQAILAVKDEYIFDFLDLGAEHTERDLEKAIRIHIQKFLKEFGGYFSFIDNQYRLEVNDKEFFIDILLFHRKLQCLVAIELKIGDFKPEYISKMNFYLSVLDDTVKMSHENASIGIILCKQKDRTIVEYSLRDTNKPIGVAEYTIHTSLPETLEGLLPNYESIMRFLQTIE